MNVIIIKYVLILGFVLIGLKNGGNHVTVRMIVQLMKYVLIIHVPRTGRSRADILSV